MAISSRYFERRAELKQRLRNGTIDVLLINPTNHACYFCLKKIDGTMVLLLDRDDKIEARYSLHMSCYSSSKN